MAYNNSNKEKTIKTMKDAIPSDTWQIDNFLLYCDYKNNLIPIASILDQFRDYFEQDGFLEEVTLDKKFHYSPAAFAEFYYGTPDLDFLVMYFAKVNTLFDFNKKTIKVLNPERLKDVNKLIIQYKDTVEKSKTNPVQYK